MADRKCRSEGGGKTLVAQHTQVVEPGHPKNSTQERAFGFSLLVCNSGWEAGVLFEMFKRVPDGSGQVYDSAAAVPGRCQAQGGGQAVMSRLQQLLGPEQAVQLCTAASVGFRQIPGRCLRS